MAKEEKKDAVQKPPKEQPQLPQNCAVASCKSKINRLNFCEDHFVWFKEGLVNKRGEKPRDFDKKYQAFMRKKVQAA